jgi:tartrate-resistant acid phosphatase type 5
MMRLLLAVAIFASLFQQHVSGLHFVSIGDWGDDDPVVAYQQKAVAQAMSEWCGSHDCLFIQTTGDNFYPDGVTSATDPRFDTSWCWIYNLTNIDAKQWYIAIGNHDHGPDGGREEFQLEFALMEPRWIFPSRWYDLHYTDGVTRIHLIIIDSESLRQDRNDPAAQLSWLETTLAGPTTDDWRIVVDHHPPYSAGDHGPTEPTIVAEVVPLCLQYGVDLFLSGHDHNLQHVGEIDGRTIDYVVSGAGGQMRYRKFEVNEAYLNGIGFQVDYFGYVHGFVAFDFEPTTYTAHFVDKDLNVTYTYSRSR